MKINVEFDLTPDEFRRSLGLPDVEAFQKDLLDRIHKQMESGVEGRASSAASVSLPTVVVTM